MKLKKALFCTLVTAISIFTLAGCGGSDSGDSSTSGSDGGQSFNLKLGHNLAEDHTVHISMVSFSDDVKASTDGSVSVQIIPNGTLGSETDMLAQIQTGALDMAKVSASTLGNFNELYNAYSVPYVFDDKDHYYKVMDGDITESIFSATEGDGFIGLTWLDSGSRSFYTVDKAIRTPADLKGLKIRTMDSQMAIDMMNALGGSATVMGYSDIYTGLQQGVINGAENNVTALRDHGEVAKFYSFDEHTRIPDVVVISSKVWNSMSEEQRATIKECAVQATDEYKGAWEAFENEVLENAVTNFGVELIRDVDIPAFQEAVQPIYEKLEQDSPAIYDIVKQIRDQA